MGLLDMPKDPVMLLSFVNMRLRDEEINLAEFAAGFSVSEESIKEKLSAVGYTYDEKLNKFV